MEGQPHFFPVFLKLEGTQTACLGEGKEIQDRIARLLECKSTVYHALISEEGPDVVQRFDPGPPEITGSEPDFRNLHWVREMRMVIVDPSYLVSQKHWTGQDLLTTCNRHNTLLCVLDRPLLSNYISPAVIRRDPFQVAISSSGISPSLSVYMKERIREDLLTEEMARLAYFFKKYRNVVKERIPALEDRRKFYVSLLESDLGSTIALSEATALERFKEMLDAHLSRKSTRKRPRIGQDAENAYHNAEPEKQ